ncbi:MAG: 2-dehydropantoate 2-reductase [Synergistaceae bacterium]|jgi:2-dehydropantoate 2-reductase|nr:2-dehydropantoate 2-reductase [Synergistaceae bacterium]
MKIAVIGAGAMGSILGGRLAAAGNDVWLVDIFQAHVDAINQNGLRIKKGDRVDTIKIKAAISADAVYAEIGLVDLVLIFVKGIYTEAAIKSAQKLIGDHTYVLTVQNGVGNADILAKYVPQERVLMGTTLSAGGMIEPGFVLDSSPNNFTQIMPMKGEVGPAVKMIVDAMNKAGWETEATPDAEQAIWNKLAVNCCTNACCTITRLTCGQVCEAPFGRNLLTDVIKEVCAVANAKGLPLDWEKVSGHFFDVYSSSPHYPSMLQDAKKKAKTEVEMITGAVVRDGERLGVPVPVNRTIYNLISMISNHYDDQMY